jgi:uncharacterized protein YjbI with pentapeptide repeats
MSKYTFEQTITGTPALAGEYEKCRFEHCELSQADLSGIKFIDCTWHHSNLSLAKLNHTAFQSNHFLNCKLLGLSFAQCNPFLLSLQFENCLMSMVSFYNLKLKGTLFTNCQLHEADFTAADFTQAVFNNCDLQLATFDQTTLEKADLRTAFNYSIYPDKNKIKKARFSTQGLSGLLQHYGIVIED